MCFINIRTCHSHGHCWDYRPGGLSLKSSYCNSFENRLGAWWHQAITWTKVDLSSMRFCDNHLRAFSHQTPWPWITEMSLKITYLNFESNLPGAIELSEIWWKWISHYTGCVQALKSALILPWKWWFFPEKCLKMTISSLKKKTSKYFVIFYVSLP